MNTHIFLDVDGNPISVDNDVECVQVHDTTTGLVWMRQTLEGGRMSLSGAEKAAIKFQLGTGVEWRLPTIREFLTLVKYERFAPAIDAIFDCESDWYWTSTDVAAHRGEFVWGVDFCYGHSDSLNRHLNKAFVRLVRSVAPRQ
ncbi:MAG TPA: DUF1566 domain-containing protein [Burkholderiales bacterium]|nr:DUF1566 domain-containing protein [Burkholderiales bacterium]